MTAAAARTALSVSGRNCSPLPARRWAGTVQVNATTIRVQNGVEIAELADGKYVMTWNNQSDDVRAQMFNADGSTFGGEFKVNSTDSSSRSRAR